MADKKVYQKNMLPKPSWLYVLVLLVVIEKILQHIVVTAAFYYNWTDIASFVVVSPQVLMIFGAFVAVLFLLGLWGLVKKQRWAVNLVIGLAVFDIIGEFVAQGRLDIVITISILAAVLLLFLASALRRQWLASLAEAG